MNQNNEKPSSNASFNVAVKEIPIFLFHKELLQELEKKSVFKMIISEHVNHLQDIVNHYGEIFKFHHFSEPQRKEFFSQLKDADLNQLGQTLKTIKKTLDECLDYAKKCQFYLRNDYWQQLKLVHQNNPGLIEKINILQEKWRKQGYCAHLESIKLLQLIKMVTWSQQYIVSASLELATLQPQSISIFNKYEQYLKKLQTFFEKEIFLLMESIIGRFEIAFSQYDLNCDDVLWGLVKRLDEWGLYKSVLWMPRRGMDADVVNGFCDIVFSGNNSIFFSRFKDYFEKNLPKGFSLNYCCQDGSWLLLPGLLSNDVEVVLSLEAQHFFKDKYSRIIFWLDMALLETNAGANSFLDADNNIHIELIEKSMLASNRLMTELRLIADFNKAVNSPLFVEYCQAISDQSVKMLSYLINRVEYLLRCIYKNFEKCLPSSNCKSELNKARVAFQAVAMISGSLNKVREFLKRDFGSLQDELYKINVLLQKYLLAVFFQNIQVLPPLVRQISVGVTLPDLQSKMIDLEQLYPYLDHENKRMIMVIVQWCQADQAQDGLTFVEGLLRLFSILSLQESEKIKTINFIIKNYLLPQLVDLDSSLASVIRLLKGDLWYKEWCLNFDKKMNLMISVLEFVFTSQPELYLDRSYRVEILQCSLVVDFFLIRNLFSKIKILVKQKHSGMVGLFNVIHKYLQGYTGDNERYAVLFEMLADQEFLEQYIVKFFLFQLKNRKFHDLAVSSSIAICLSFQRIKQVCSEIVFRYSMDLFDDNAKNDFEKIRAIYEGGIYDVISKFSDLVVFQDFIARRDQTIFRYLRIMFSLCNTSHASDMCAQWLELCQKWCVMFPLDIYVRDQWFGFLDDYQHKSWNAVCHQLVERFANLEQLQRYCFKWLEDFLCPAVLNLPSMFLPCEQLTLLLFDEKMCQQTLQLMLHCLKKNLGDLVYYDQYDRKAIDYVGQMIALGFFGKDSNEMLLEVKSQYQFFCAFLNDSRTLRMQVHGLIDQLLLQDYNFCFLILKNCFYGWLALGEENESAYRQFFIFWRYFNRLLRAGNKKLFVEFLVWLGSDKVLKIELSRLLRSAKKWLLLYLMQMPGEDQQEVQMLLSLVDHSLFLSGPLKLELAPKDADRHAETFSAMDVRNMSIVNGYLSCYSLGYFDCQKYQVTTDFSQNEEASEKYTFVNSVNLLVKDYLHLYPQCYFANSFFNFMLISLFKSLGLPEHEMTDLFLRWIDCLSALVLARPLEMDPKEWSSFGEVLSIIVGILQQQNICSDRRERSGRFFKEMKQLDLKLKEFLNFLLEVVLRDSNFFDSIDLLVLPMIYRSSSVYFEKLWQRYPAWVGDFCSEKNLNKLFGLEVIFPVLKSSIVYDRLEKYLSHAALVQCKTIFEIAKIYITVDQQLKLLNSFSLEDPYWLQEHLSSLVFSLQAVKNKFPINVCKKYIDMLEVMRNLQDFFISKKVIHFKGPPAVQQSNWLNGANCKSKSSCFSGTWGIFSQQKLSRVAVLTTTKRQDVEIKNIIATIVSWTFEGLVRLEASKDFQLLVDSLYCYCAEYFYCFKDPVFFHQHVDAFMKKLAKAYVNHLVEKNVSAKINFVVNNYNPYALLKNRKYIFSSPSMNRERLDGKDLENDRRAIGEIGLRACKAYGLPKMSQRTSNVNINFSTS